MSFHVTSRSHTSQRGSLSVGFSGVHFLTAEIRMAVQTTRAWMRVRTLPALSPSTTTSKRARPAKFGLDGTHLTAHCNLLVALNAGETHIRRWCLGVDRSVNSQMRGVACEGMSGLPTYDMLVAVVYRRRDLTGW